jgi:sugar phosphate isomerase/epimerase
VRERGIVAGALEVSEIAALLESGIEIMAARPDAAVNPELEELYYAAARLYLSVPDSGIVRWALRLEGDRARAVEYLRRATAIAGPRADYQIELGTALVCLGRTGGDAESQVEGFALLQAVAARDDVSDDLRRRARERLESPGCG